MDNNKGQTIFLSVIGIATLLVAIIGATFAYFSITVTGNEQASSIFVTTATLGQINFVDGTQIKWDKVNLEKGGTDKTESKTFTVENTAATALTSDVTYDVYMKVTDNTISAAANGSAGAGASITYTEGAQKGTTKPLTSGEDYFVYKIEDADSNTAGKVNDGDVLINIPETAVPVVSTDTTKGTKLSTTSGKMATGGLNSKHVYKFTLTLKNAADATQNGVQGKSFAGQLQVYTD